MSELKIKSCPFCGGEAFLKDGNPTTFGTFEALVICKNCSASVVGVSRINFATYRFEKMAMTQHGNKPLRLGTGEMTNEYFSCLRGIAEGDN